MPAKKNTSAPNIDLNKVAATSKVRQIAADPRYPSVAVPVIVDNDEYDGQLNVYKRRCEKAQLALDQAKKAREAEEEVRKAQEAAEAAKKKKVKGKGKEKKVSFVYFVGCSS